MDIKASCKYDYEAICALTHLSLFKRSDPQKRMRLWTVIYVILTLVVVAEICIFGMDSKLLILLIVCILGCSLIFVLKHLLPKMKYKSLGSIQNVVNHYSFQDEQIVANAEGREMEGPTVLSYDSLFCVFETKAYFFLFPDKKQAYLVDKSTITNGTSDQIRDHMQQSGVKKYYICKY